MSRFRVRPSRLVAVGVVGSILFQSGCGTIFYPERRGQERGKIDPTVAILNAIGLLFFLIPGLIAFAVDFSTGAIYLPPEEDPGAVLTDPVTYLDPSEMTPERIAAVIKEHTGKDITLTEEDLRIMRLNAQTHDERAQTTTGG